MNIQLRQASFVFVSNFLIGGAEFLGRKIGH